MDSNDSDLDFLRDRIRQNQIDRKIREEQLDSSLPPLESFINLYEISPGNDKISTHILYSTYLLATPRLPNHVTLSKIDFFRKLCKNITKVRHGNQRYYMIDRSKFRLSKEDELNLRIANEQQKERF